MDDRQAYHSKRRRIEQFINAAHARLRAAAVGQNVQHAQRAAEDMAQAIDELLDLMGGHQLTGSGQQLDCPDCGQYLGES